MAVNNLLDEISRNPNNVTPRLGSRETAPSITPYNPTDVRRNAAQTILDRYRHKLSPTPLYMQNLERERLSLIPRVNSRLNELTHPESPWDTLADPTENRFRRISEILNRFRGSSSDPIQRMLTEGSEDDPGRRALRNLYNLSKSLYTLITPGVWPLLGNPMFDPNVDWMQGEQNILGLPTEGLQYALGVPFSSVLGLARDLTRFGVDTLDDREVNLSADFPLENYESGSAFIDALAGREFTAMSSPLQEVPTGEIDPETGEETYIEQHNPYGMISRAGEPIFWWNDDREKPDEWYEHLGNFLWGAQPLGWLFSSPRWRDPAERDQQRRELGLPPMEGLHPVQAATIRAWDAVPVQLQFAAAFAVEALADPLDVIGDALIPATRAIRRSTSVPAPPTASTIPSIPAPPPRSLGEDEGFMLVPPVPNRGDDGIGITATPPTLGEDEGFMLVPPVPNRGEEAVSYPATPGEDEGFLVSLATHPIEVDLVPKSAVPTIVLGGGEAMDVSLGAARDVIKAQVGRIAYTYDIPSDHIGQVLSRVDEMPVDEVTTTLNNILDNYNLDGTEVEPITYSTDGILPRPSRPIRIGLRPENNNNPYSADPITSHYVAPGSPVLDGFDDVWSIFTSPGNVDELFNIGDRVDDIVLWAASDPRTADYLNNILGSLPLREAELEAAPLTPVNRVPVNTADVMKSGAVVNVSKPNPKRPPDATLSGSTKGGNLLPGSVVTPDPTDPTHLIVEDVGSVVGLSQEIIDKVTNATGRLIPDLQNLYNLLPYLTDMNLLRADVSETVDPVTVSRFLRLSEGYKDAPPGMLQGLADGLREEYNLVKQPDISKEFLDRYNSLLKNHTWTIELPYMSLLFDKPKNNLPEELDIYVDVEEVFGTTDANKIPLLADRADRLLDADPDVLLEEGFGIFLQRVSKPTPNLSEEWLDAAALLYETVGGRDAEILRGWIRRILQWSSAGRERAGIVSKPDWDRIAQKVMNGNITQQDALNYLLSPERLTDELLYETHPFSFGSRVTPENAARLAEVEKGLNDIHAIEQNILRLLDYRAAEVAKFKTVYDHPSQPPVFQPLQTNAPIFAAIHSNSPGKLVPGDFVFHSEELADYAANSMVKVRKNHPPLPMAQVQGVSLPPNLKVYTPGDELDVRALVQVKPELAPFLLHKPNRIVISDVKPRTAKGAYDEIGRFKKPGTKATDSINKTMRARLKQALNDAMAEVYDIVGNKVTSEIVVSTTSEARQITPKPPKVRAARTQALDPSPEHGKQEIRVAVAEIDASIAAARKETPAIARKVEENLGRIASAPSVVPPRTTVRNVERVDLSDPAVARRARQVRAYGKMAMGDVPYKAPPLEDEVGWVRRTKTPQETEARRTEMRRLHREFKKQNKVPEFVPRDYLEREHHRKPYMMSLVDQWRIEIGTEVESMNRVAANVDVTLSPRNIDKALSSQRDVDAVVAAEVRRRIEQIRDISSEADAKRWDDILHDLGEDCLL